jgi:hypothetical protein
MAAKKLIADLVGLELSQAEAAQSGSGAQFMVIWLDQAESLGSAHRQPKLPHRGEPADR